VKSGSVGSLLRAEELPRLPWFLSKLEVPIAEQVLVADGGLHRLGERAATRHLEVSQYRVIALVVQSGDLTYRNTGDADLVTLFEE